MNIFCKLLTVVLTLTSLQGCNNWIFRIDIPQGNFLDQRDVKKLRVGMTKEQVIYVLGNPVVKDAFDNDTWYYVYDMKRGMKKRGEDVHQELVLVFEDEKLQSATGDFELSEDFLIPLDQ
jgi:outer membrane protein assembly factor BamE